MSDIFDEPDNPSPDGKIRRDRFGRYLLPDPLGRSAHDMVFPRVTTVAKSISDTFVLNQWQQRMVALGLVARPDLYALVAATDPSDRETLNTITEQAKDAASMRARANLGTAVHAFTERVDRGAQSGAPEELESEVELYRAVMDWAGLEVEEIERVVVNLVYGVAGTFDRIVKVTRPFTAGEYQFSPGDRVVLDLKTGRDLSYGWNEIAVQLALYAHSRHMWRIGTREYDPMPSVRTDVALVVHVPIQEGAQPPRATLHAVDIVRGWAAAELCHQVRGWRATRDLSAVAVVATTTAEPSVTPVAAPSVAELPSAAPSVAELPSAVPHPDRCGGHNGVLASAGPCIVIGPHMTHDDGAGYRWPVSDLPEGQVCIQCQRPVTGGKISHRRGCPSATRGKAATPIPAREVQQEPPAVPVQQEPPAVPVQQEQPTCTVCGSALLDGCCGECARDVTALDVQEPPAPVQQEPPAPVQPAGWTHRIESATTRAELSAIRAEALAAGQWTPALQAAGMFKLGQLT